MNPHTTKLQETTYDVCMISTRHPLFDQRIFYKETASLRERLGLRILVIYFDTRPAFHQTKHADVLVLKKKGNNPLSFIRTLKRTLRHVNAKAYHLHDFDVLALIPYLKHRKGAKVIYDVHENYQKMIQESPRFNKFLRSVLKKASLLYERHYSTKADSLIIVVDHHAKKFRRWGFKKSITTIKNLPILDLYKRSEEKKKYDFVYCGTASKDRGLMDIVEFIKAHDKYTALLVMSGRVEEREKIKKAIRQHGLQERIAVKEKIPFKQVPKEISKARIGLVLFHDNPKRRDGFSTKLIEYAATGLPSITTTVNHRMRRFVEDYKAGVAIKTINPKTIKRAVETIEKDYQKYSRKALAGAEENSWQTEAEKLARMYQKLLKRMKP